MASEITRTALMVARLQPLHCGHCRIIDHMIRNFKTVIVAVGSTQLNREKHNPWTFEERKEMLRNVYGDRIKIIQLTDLGTTDTSTEWVDYVIDKVKKIGLPEPTDYFTGSEADSTYYSKRFVVDGDDKKLHILDRTEIYIPSGTEIRTFLEMRNDGWKKWVPSLNHSVVEENFPQEFRIKE